jgi:hypothetical protein
MSVRQSLHAITYVRKVDKLVLPITSCLTNNQDGRKCSKQQSSNIKKLLTSNFSRITLFALSRGFRWTQFGKLYTGKSELLTNACSFFSLFIKNGLTCLIIWAACNCLYLLQEFFSNRRRLRPDHNDGSQPVSGDADCWRQLRVSQILKTYEHTAPVESLHKIHSSCNTRIDILARSPPHSERSTSIFPPSSLFSNGKLRHITCVCVCACVHYAIKTVNTNRCFTGIYCLHHQEVIWL